MVGHIRMRIALYNVTVNYICRENFEGRPNESFSQLIYCTVQDITTNLESFPPTLIVLYADYNLLFLSASLTIMTATYCDRPCRDIVGCLVVGRW